MAYVQWQRGPAPSSLLQAMLPGMVGASRGLAENRMGDFQYNDQLRREGQARQNAVDADARSLDHQKTMAAFNAAVRADEAQASSGYNRLMRRQEIDQLRTQMGPQWTPELDTAAEVYRLTGDHSALRNAISPLYQAQVAGQNLTNAGHIATNAYTDARTADLQAKGQREATVRQQLSEGVDSTTREDLLNNDNAYFNDTGDGQGPDGGMSRGQYDENVRTSLANLQNGQNAATLGKAYQFDRPRIVREARPADPATAARLQAAEDRRQEQAESADLRAHVKELAKEIDAEPDQSSPDVLSKKEELRAVQAELARRALSRIPKSGGVGTKPPATGPVPKTGTVDYKKTGRDLINGTF